MKYTFALAVFLFAALPAGAETIEELKAQLEAQKQINALPLSYRRAILAAFGKEFEQPD